MSKPFEFENTLRQSWSFHHTMTDDVRLLLQNMARRNRHDLYKELDKQVHETYTKKLAEVNNQHKEAGLMKKNTKTGMYVSTQTVTPSTLLEEAAAEVIQQLKTSFTNR